MTVTIMPAQIGGEVKAIASKSQAHRMLICAALSDCPCEIICGEASADIEATVSCLNSLGAKITRCNESYKVTPISEIPKKAELDCGESGSTLRFILPVVGALGVDAKIKMHGRLPERPLSPLREELEKKGCVIEQSGDVLRCRGQLESGEFVIDGGVSSQFISGLLFALPLLSEESKITVTGRLQSKKYVDMTLEAQEKFGVVPKRTESGFEIKPGSYTSPNALTVEGDWSNSAFWLTAGALSENPVKCFGIRKSSLQGDKAICEVLSRFGAKVAWQEDFAEACKAGLSAAEIDASDIPDLVPIIAAVASVARGKTVIKNAERLRIKECDRLRAVSKTLGALGADITETADGLIIVGKERLFGGEIDSCNDHRIAMTAAIASIVCESEVKILGAEAVNKSYPTFFEDFKKLGGQIVTEA